MKKWLESFLVTADDSDASYGRLVKTVLGAFLLALLVVIGVLLINQPDRVSVILVLGLLWLLLLATFLLALRKIYWPGRLIIPLAVVASMTYIATQIHGLRDTSIAALPIAVLIAALLLGSKAVLAISLLVVGSLVFIGYRDITGITPSTVASTIGIEDIVIHVMVQVIIAASLTGLMNRLTEALKQSKENQKRLEDTNQELLHLKQNLEEQVTQRTLELQQRARDLSERSAELEQANIHLQRRAKQFQAIAETTRAIASIRNLNDLLARIVNVVSTEFGFYHAGIFLVDEANQYAVLSAASSEGGQRMLARGHRLEVGSKSIVGYVTGMGLPRIALNTGADAVFFNNPNLPETRSEMALPLVAEKRIIGALDVQSKQPNAFTQDDIEVLSALADQISIAIETARLFEKSEKALAEAETLSRQYTQRGWNRADGNGQILGYRYTVSGAEPLQAPEVLAAPKEVTLETGENATLTLPIQLRGEAIGLLNIRVPRKEFWKQDELKIVQAVAERVAIAADNARLYEESQRRAEKERTLGIISEKLSKEVNLENIFRTALQELGQLVPGSEVFIAFETDQTA